MLPFMAIDNHVCATTYIKMKIIQNHHFFWHLNMKITHGLQKPACLFISFDNTNNSVIQAS